MTNKLSSGRAKCHSGQEIGYSLGSLLPFIVILLIVSASGSAFAQSCEQTLKDNAFLEKIEATKNLLPAETYLRLRHMAWLFPTRASQKLVFYYILKVLQSNSSQKLKYIHNLLNPTILPPVANNKPPKGEPEILTTTDPIEKELSLKSQIEVAETLARLGLFVEYVREGHTSPQRLKAIQEREGLSKGRSPDLIIGKGEASKLYDIYTPVTHSISTIFGNLKEKIQEGQTKRIIIDLSYNSKFANSSGINAIKEWLYKNTDHGIIEVFVVIPGGTGRAAERIFPAPLWYRGQSN